MRRLLLTVALTPSWVLALALATPLGLGGCVSGPPGASLLGGDWQEAGGEPHPALAEGVTIVWWTRGMGPERERVGALRTTEGDVRPDGLAELARYCRPPDGPEAAISYAALAQRLSVPDVPVAGQPVEYVRRQAGRAEGGQFTAADAAAWGIDPEAPARRAAGGYRFEQVVLVPPEQHPDLASFVTPWRMVLIETTVYPDGAITGRETRTLTNGEDAERFVRF